MRHSDSEIAQRGKQCDLKNDQWILLEELVEVLKPYEQATVFLSGQSYVTASVLPPPAERAPEIHPEENL